MPTEPATGLLARLLGHLSTARGALVAAPLLVGAAAFLTAGQPPAPALAQAGAEAFNPAQRKAIEAIIKDYLVNNPEVLMEATKELEKRQAAQQAAEAKKLIVSRKNEIFRAPTDFVGGNPKGDVVVVEFLDYNCGWCKKALDEVNKLTKADPNVRIVMKEFPIFGENSTFAAKAALASIRQGKYWELHTAMMRERQVTKDNALKIAEKVGLDVTRLQADMADPKLDEALKATAQLAQALGIEGTPSFIIDTRVNPGFMPVAGMRELIAEVRKNGCQVC